MDDRDEQLRERTLVELHKDGMRVKLAEGTIAEWPSRATIRRIQMRACAR
jgi:hypothetical protein